MIRNGSHKNADLSVLASPSSIKPIFSVPFERNKQFVGREDILSRIEEGLQNEHLVCLYGLGGIGYELLQHMPYGQLILTNMAESLKSLSNTLTGSGALIHTAMFSGCM